MTLDTSPQYDQHKVTPVGQHAVVIGAGMAGLLAARVLHDAYESVTLLDRDRLGDEPSSRRGVPQSQHIHVLQEAGRRTLESQFPGYSDELETRGTPIIDMTRDLGFYDEGDFIAEAPTDLPLYCGTRPLFEYVTRERLADLAGVRIRDQCQFTGYQTDDSGTAVQGVGIRNQSGDTEEISADLVVDATGRTSKTGSWLDNHGYEQPPTEEVSVDLAYSTLELSRPPSDQRAFIVMPSSPRTRGAGLFPVENDRWVVTAYGMHGDHPPTEIDTLTEFLTTLPIDEIGRLVIENEILSEEVSHYPFPASLKRNYWNLSEFPDGLLVIGDAIASFNPIYGQGMSVAALEALHLHDALASGSQEGVADRYFDRIEQVVEDAWALAVGSDFQFSQTSGPKPSGTDLLNRYIGRLTRKAHTDGVLSEAYTRVAMMEKRPTSLLHPRIMWRVLNPIP